MAQTKRKRRTKHRGNAAGVVETRGRTGRRPTAEEQKKASREQRLSKPPTWNSAFMKAGLMAGLLFLFTRLGVFGSNTTVAQSVILCFFALLLYTPIAYATDRFVYTRAQKRKQQS
jgi:drug/metabolite transporter (DMT)-like permease